LQEIVNLNTQSYISHADWQLKEDIWIQAIDKLMPKENKFIRKEKIRMFGLLLLLYISDNNDKNVSQIYKSHIATGIMGHVGNLI
jgi:hypothetical protein